MFFNRIWGVVSTSALVVLLAYVISTRDSEKTKRIQVCSSLMESLTKGTFGGGGDSSVLDSGANQRDPSNPASACPYDEIELATMDSLFIRNTTFACRNEF